MPCKRLRILAGPNGSGKSTVYRELCTGVNMGVFVNADLIEAELRSRRYLDVGQFSPEIDSRQFVTFYSLSGLSQRSLTLPTDFTVSADNLKIELTGFAEIDSYFAAAVADFIRYALLNLVDRITVETVMSDRSKFDYIRAAAECGYRIYLYYISTVSPSINIGRVDARHLEGGHNVSHDKIVARYTRSLDNLYDAVGLCDRAYFFDNSGTKFQFLAEYSKEEHALTFAQDTVPEWLHKNLIEKITRQ
ncbi:MAG: hypothetical protein SOZ00_07030 [Tidjanibacter sp.]|nr:hypothetical protein [Tidjanibacter sp.]